MRLEKTKAESDLHCLHHIYISFVIIRYLLFRLFNFNLYIPLARLIFVILYIYSLLNVLMCIIYILNL